MSRDEAGRGLAAVLPGTDEAPQSDDHDPPDHGTRPLMSIATDLAAEAAVTESGIAIVYRALDTLVTRYALDDAAIVIEEAGLGRQIFRAGRRTVDDAHEWLLDAAPGLYTEPALDSQDFDRSLIASLCVMALRLDVVRYDAWHDALTGLYDRRSFDRLLEMAIARSVRYGWPFTLVIIDLDHLKEINDREGHPAGDTALREFGERFRRALRFGDNAARIGGDEFAMLLPNTEPDLVPALLDRVREAPGFERPCPEFSFGVAVCPAEADEFDALVRLADDRLFEEKGRRP